MKTIANVANNPIWQNQSIENLQNEVWKPVKGFEGFIVSIDRVSKSKFTFLVNGTAIKSYKQRDSCNRQLVKLYNQNK